MNRAAEPPDQPNVDVEIVSPNANALKNAPVRLDSQDMLGTQHAGIPNKFVAHPERLAVPEDFVRRRGQGPDQPDSEICTRCPAFTVTVPWADAAAGAIMMSR